MHRIAIVNDQRDAQLNYNQFLFHSFCLLYMFRTNLVVHHQENKIIYRTVVYSTLFCAPDEERLDSFETCRGDKNCGIKLIITELCISLVITPCINVSIRSSTRPTPYPKLTFFTSCFNQNLCSCILSHKQAT